MAREPTAGLSGPPFAATLAVALIIELGLVIAVVLSLAPTEPRRPMREQPFQVSLVAAPAPAASQSSRKTRTVLPPELKAQRKPQPKPLTPEPKSESKPKLAPKPEPKPKLALKPKPEPKPQPVPAPRPSRVEKRRPPRRDQQPLPRQPASPPVIPRAVSPRPAVPIQPTRNPKQPQSPSGPTVAEIGHLTASFKEQVQAAVQSAAGYPRAARMLGLQGEVEIAFDFRNGQVSNVRIARSSNATVLDQAALRAVRTADYPASPSALDGRRLQFSIVIRFRQS